MKFEDRLLEHLRIAAIAGLSAAGHDLNRTAPTDAGEALSQEFVYALGMLDGYREVLGEAGLSGDCADVDVEKHGEIILSALLTHAHGERDRIADEVRVVGVAEAAFDDSKLQVLTREYAELKDAIHELKTRGLGVREQVPA
jgi:hypothetical protein